MLNAKKNRGFFEELHTLMLSEISEDNEKCFSELKNDFERVQYIYNLPKLNKYTINISITGKDKASARILKDKGNLAFQKGFYRKALDFYTQSLLKSPLDHDLHEVSIIRANRSATLYHLNEYKAALIEINAALDLGYPSELMYKLKDRKARCLLALKQHESAIDALRETITSLDVAKLPLERRQKWQNDIQIMTAMMLKNKVNDEKMSTYKKHKLAGKCNAIYKAGSEAVDIKFDGQQGRYAAAKKDIKSGDVIVVENAHCAVLSDDKRQTNCFHCLKRLVAAEPCSTCDRISFCNQKCKEAALNSHHSVECCILETLWNSGISITCLMALRIISQQKPEYFLRLKNELMNQSNSGEKVWSKGTYSSENYLTVNQLVKHEKERKPEGFLHKALVACFLFRCLKEAGYFKEVAETERKECEAFIGGLILRNLQIVQFNAHEVSELKLQGDNLHKCKSLFIGAALYPTLAFFNHSCDPALVRYFDGTTVIVRALRTIKAGEIIPENYGPIYTQTRRDERQKELKDHYWFECSCKACTENWPTLEAMDPGVLRFQCQNKECASVIEVPCNTMQFMAICLKCNKHTNILPGLKVLQDSESLYTLGQDLMKKGDVEQSLKKFHELLDLLDGTLLPPFRDYTLCLQALKTCYLAAGNKCSTHEELY